MFDYHKWKKLFTLYASSDNGRRGKMNKKTCAPTPLLKYRDTWMNYCAISGMNG